MPKRLIRRVVRYLEDYAVGDGLIGRNERASTGWPLHSGVRVQRIPVVRPRRHVCCRHSFFLNTRSAARSCFVRANKCRLLFPDRKVMAPKISSATLRLKQDYVRLKNDPVPYVVAEPNPSNILEWYVARPCCISVVLYDKVCVFYRYYVVNGPEDSPYAGGYYLGRLVFPRDFPFKPPSIYMITPNGRFKTNTRLCLSISDYHPDTWNPAWSVSTILTGLLSFMVLRKKVLRLNVSEHFTKFFFFHTVHNILQ